MVQAGVPVAQEQQQQVAFSSIPIYSTSRKLQQRTVHFALLARSLTATVRPTVPRDSADAPCNH